ncbi:hypothetical protein V9T40_009304 [Parthenolecanium corni]|uniref:Uncharacterized protein n=1 Tax=Parthenolecanium corni TaxID=536013 RepID=A0AAN9Y6M2_9HEMI
MVLEVALKQYFCYVIHYEGRNDIPDPDNCNLVECQNIDSISKNLNSSVDPCEDFYEYACGGWIKNNPVPETQILSNQFQVVTEKVFSQIKEILETDSENDPLPVRAASLYYKTCTNSEKIENDGLNRLVTFLAEYGNWPITMEKWSQNNFDWQTLSTDSIRRLSVLSLMDVYVGLDRLNSSQSVILIDQPNTVLSRSILTDANNYKNILEAYRSWIGASAMLISKYLNQSVPVNIVEEKVSYIVDFEIELAKLTSNEEMRRNAYRLYNNRTLRNLQDWTDLATSSFKINWLKIINDLFQNTGMHIDYDHRVVVKEWDYFYNLANLLHNTRTETLANYLHWRIVRIFSSHLNREMRDLSNEFIAIHDGVVQSEPRWKDCLVTVTNDLGFAVGYAYVKLHFDDEAMIMTKEMVDNIIAAFSQELKNAEWMDDATKNSALDKVKSMTHLVGYPEWYHNESALYAYYDGLTVGSTHFENVEQVQSFLFRKNIMQLSKETNRKEWVQGPIIVNAFNSEHRNAIILPAGVLQPPFFDTKRIMAMNYGSLGAVIGHEILHSFDDRGRRTDKYGNLAQWWTEHVISTYEKKTQCFIDQYSNLTVFTSDTNQTYSVNGVYTLGENIADNSGLRQAFFAYRKYVKDKGEEKPQHGNRQFTAEQLFFLSYAATWCETTTKQSLMHEVLNDPHCPHRIRVTQTLSNSPEFAKTFKCPENTLMNPEKKCIIW